MPSDLITEILNQISKLFSILKVRSYFLICLGLTIILASCSFSADQSLINNNTSHPTTVPVQKTVTPSNPPKSDLPQPPYSTWIDPRLPESILDLVTSQSEFEISHNPESAQISISSTGQNIIGYWIYAVVAPFPSQMEVLQSKDLINLWKYGRSDEIKLYLCEDTYQSLTLLWGEPNQDLITIVNPEHLIPEVWGNTNSIAIIPFESLEARWKILALDNINPLDSNFSPDTYPLALPIVIDETIEVDLSEINNNISNFSEQKLTSIALTGVTALVRDTAAIMEEKGVLYPATDIQPYLVDADITHISNEVPFAEDCPSPDSNQPSLYFCSKDEYIQLLESVGTDIVELSGDHFGDWGPEAMLHSLVLYHQRNWLVYGGGETLQAGLDPVYIEHNGNQFAFIGCNGKVHDSYATATESNPGASRCDFEWMLPEITRLVEKGYLVIATMQHEEVDSYKSIAIQQYDFRRLAEAGATIVSGSQAHHPQSVEFYGPSFIHYGLGNLFFDQWYLAKYNPGEHKNKDKAFIDIHYFYDGSYINSRLIPILFLDNARSRPMTVEEKNEFLNEVYSASVWNLPAE